MRKDGEWGGHQELYAASRLFQTAFVIHQFNAPMFHINSEASNGRTYHLSYHGEMHYNSVRRMDDEVIPKTPPKQITLQLHQAPSSSSSQNNSNAASLEAERLVSISLPDVSLKHIRLTLMDVDGNPEHAIELLVSGYIPVAGSADDDVDTTGIEVIKSEGNQEIEFDETFSKALDEIANTPPTSTSTTTTSSSSSSTKTTTKSKVNKKKNNKTIETEEIVKEVKPIRGGLCPCGSNKKYKKCCMKADQRKQTALKSTDESGDIPQSTIGFGAISI
jgi:OTU domain-containing protein 3